MSGEVGWLDHGRTVVVQRPTFRQYLALFVTILFGVAGGILLASWVIVSVARAPGGSVAEKAGHMAGDVGSEIHAVYQHAVAMVTGEEEAVDAGSPE